MKTKGEMDDAYLAAQAKWDDEGDPETAFVMFSQLAEQGYASAQHCLGCMYGTGEVVEKDDAKSLYWHKRAGRTSKNAGYEYFGIAVQYEQMGNRRRALYWWNKMVSLGDKTAGLELAKRLLQNGRSDSRRRAIALLQIAADAEKQIEISENDKEEAQELLDGLTKSVA